MAGEREDIRAATDPTTGSACLVPCICSGSPRLAMPVSFLRAPMIAPATAGESPWERRKRSLSSLRHFHR